MATLASRDPTGILRAGPGELELPALRTRCFKHFRLPNSPDGRPQYRVAGMAAPIHYRADPFSESAFEEIELDIKPTPDRDWDAACETNGYQVRFWQSRLIGGKRIRYIAQYRRAGRWFAMAPVALAWINGAGDIQMISAPKAVEAPTIDNEANTITWYGVFGDGLDFQYVLRPDKFYKQLIIEGSAMLPNPTIDKMGLRLALIMSVAWDTDIRASNGFANYSPADLSDDLSGIVVSPDEVVDDPESFSYVDQSDHDMWWFQRPTAWDSIGTEAAVRWRLLRKGGRAYMVFSVGLNVLDHATFPLYIDTSITEERVGSSRDDAVSVGINWPGYPAGYSSVGTEAPIGWWMPAKAENAYCLGVRFTSLPVPNAAIIDSASLQLNQSNWVGSPTIRVYGDDHDDAATWADTSDTATGRPGNRTRTAAYASLTPTSSDGWKSWSIASIIQEIVDRAGWASNQDMAFMAMSSVTSYPGDKYIQVLTYDSGSANAAKLNITYHVPQVYNETGKAQTNKIAQANSAIAVRLETRSQSISVGQSIAQVAIRMEPTSQLLLIAANQLDQSILSEALSQILLSPQNVSDPMALLENPAAIVIMLQAVSDLYVPGEDVFDETGRAQLLLLTQAGSDAASRWEMRDEHISFAQMLETRIVYAAHPIQLLLILHDSSVIPLIEEFVLQSLRFQAVGHVWYPVAWEVLARMPKAEHLIVTPGNRQQGIALPSTEAFSTILPATEGVAYLPISPIKRIVLN